MHPITKRKLYCSNESPIVKTEAEQSFCYAPKEESGCILSKRFSGRLLLRQWRRRKKERNIHNSGCICRFALEFCNYKKERTETLYQSFSPFMVEHRRLELLTPTLPVLCATNCANAPRFSEEYNSTIQPVCKYLSPIFLEFRFAVQPCPRLSRKSVGERPRSSRKVLAK